VIKLTSLESVEKGIVRGATPEQKELKAKKLSEKRHAGPDLTKPLADSK
jgi:hypothetical protein